MTAAIDTGIATEDYLPGELHVPRRAKSLHDRLEHHPERDSPSDMSWLRLYAIAVNETNASCGRVVTAPTNGACGTLPTVLAYVNKRIEPLTDDMIEDCLLTCTQIAALYKQNASISGAEVGCRGEVGVACSMAAAGYTQLLGGTRSRCAWRQRSAWNTTPA